MINDCSITDKEEIIKLGLLINKNFKKLNDIESQINNKQLIGYYIDKKLVGFISININYEILDIIYIVVNPIYRNKKIGTMLVDYIINNFNYKKIMLEVRTDNINAIKLYKRFNFKIINIRKKYYDNLDAYVMEMIK